MTMATQSDFDPSLPPQGPVTEPDFIHVTKGWKSWAFTLDHKRIGMMYLFGILCALIVGGAFAMLLRTELWAPGRTIVGQNTYNQFFTLHGAIMVFLVIIPGIPAALGNIIMPISARRARRRVPAAQPRFVLLVVLGRDPARSSRSRSAASTPAGRSTRRTRSSPRPPC